MSEPRKPHIRPLKAIRAMRKLLRDKEDTTQVFHITRALTGNSMGRLLKRVRRTESGRALLDDRRDLLTALTNRSYLAGLPEGSLGRAYLTFLETEDLSAEGLVAASEQPALPPLYEPGSDAAFLGARLRDSHDLWHVLTGYGRDGLGEVCVLAFSFAQTRNPALAFIALIGTLKFKRHFRGEPIGRAVWQAYRNGRNAAFLPGIDIESRLHAPLHEVRRELRIAGPTIYRAAGQVIANTGKPQAA